MAVRSKSAALGYPIEKNRTSILIKDGFLAVRGKHILSETSDGFFTFSFLLYGKTLLE